MSGNYWRDGYKEVDSSEIPFDELPTVERSIQPATPEAATDTRGLVGYVAVETPGDTTEATDTTVQG